MRSCHCKAVLNVQLTLLSQNLNKVSIKPKHEAVLSLIVCLINLLYWAENYTSINHRIESSSYCKHHTVEPFGV
jgi:hypothetical protein